MGGIPILAGVIGIDHAGEILKNNLKELDIDPSRLISVQDRPTIRKTRVIANDQQLIRFDREDRDNIDEETREALMECINSSLADADAILLEDYDKGLFDKQFIERIVSHADDRIITVDPKFKNFLNYRSVSAFKPNKRELERAMGLKLSTENLKQSACEMRDLLNCRYLVLTLGREGMFVAGRDETYSIPHKAMAEVHDTSGAGDTVISALTLSLVAGASIYESALIASYAAGIEVGRVGVVPVGRDELLSAIVKA